MINHIITKEFYGKKKVSENIDIGIARENSENIDNNIARGMLGNINIDKGILQNIDIDRILY